MLCLEIFTFKIGAHNVVQIINFPDLGIISTSLTARGVRRVISITSALPIGFNSFLNIIGGTFNLRGNCLFIIHIEEAFVIFLVLFHPLMCLIIIIT